jgi:hypothetical protein
MAAVREQVTLEAPYVQAVPAFERRLGLVGGTADGRCSLQLIAPVGAGREVARTVEARTERLPEANYTARYGIRWDAGTTRHGIPTPGFDGSLTLRAGEDYRSCEIVLEGSYEPPLGAAGVLFDELAGRRIASATMGALLEGVARELEHEHRDIEAGKQRP